MCVCVFFSSFLSISSFGICCTRHVCLFVVAVGSLQLQLQLSSQTDRIKKNDKEEKRKRKGESQESQKKTWRHM